MSLASWAMLVRPALRTLLSESRSRERRIICSIVILLDWVRRTNPPDPLPQTPLPFLLQEVRDCS